jgi:hypothetical protein
MGWGPYNQTIRLFQMLFRRYAVNHGVRGNEAKRGNEA